MRDFDGVRHFLEFMPPLCGLAGIGAVQLARLTSGAATVAVRSRVVAVVCTAAVVPGALATARTFPNGICYYNATLGGLAGAQAARIPDATDYWGNSYWQAIDWLNANAEEGAAIVTPIAPHLMRTSRPVKLRSDLVLDDPTRLPIYVPYITRESWYGPFLRALDGLPPAHEIRVDGAPILRIQRIGDAAARERWIALWLREQQANAARRGRSRRRRRGRRAPR
jgi:hypothetical protein